MEDNKLKIGKFGFSSRLFIGTGKYPDFEVMKKAHEASGAEAVTVAEAKQIHRSLWNLGYAPFLIVRLPDQIRVYTGFNYEEKNENGTRSSSGIKNFWWSGRCK